jgi:TPP-dependent indolepyruvate ferredoxin oxidoreductase alpha subunit
MADGVDEAAAFDFLRLEADRRGLVPIERPHLCPACPDRPLPGTFWTMRAVTREAWDREVGGA